MNKNNKSIEDVKIETIVEDYNSGTSRQQRLNKKKFYENFNKFYIENEIEIIQEIIDEIAENEEL